MKIMVFSPARTLVGALFLLSINLQAQQLPTGPDVGKAGLREVEVRQFLALLQDAVRCDDPQAFADLVHFPLKFNSYGHKQRIHSRKKFLRRYKEIVSSELKDAILKTRYEDLWARNEGLMIDNGQLWFGAVCRNDSEDYPCAYDVRILTVNRFRRGKPTSTRSGPHGNWGHPFAP